MGSTYQIQNSVLWKIHNILYHLYFINNSMP